MRKRDTFRESLTPAQKQSADRTRRDEAARNREAVRETEDQQQGRQGQDRR